MRVMLTSWFELDFLGTKWQNVEDCAPVLQRNSQGVFRMMTKLWTRMSLIAGLSVMSVIAQASLADATVLVERAANNRTLTVRYSGAAAALAELKINGQSVATRSLNEKTMTGEASFAIETAELADGENTIEIKLYDLDGKVVGTQVSKVNIDRRGTGPIFLDKPRAGSTISGPVEIKLGFRQDMRNVYVSFFINDQLRMLRQVPPFAYLWDTERERNGWHEVQAWVVDEHNNTFRTEKMRLFINNSQGRTDREGGNTGTVSLNSASGAAPSGIRISQSGSGTAGGAMTSAPTAPSAKVPAIKAPTKGTAGPKVTPNTVRSPKVAPAGTKGAATDSGSALGARNVNPGQQSSESLAVYGPRWTVASSSSVGGSVSLSTAAAGTTTLAPIAISYGTRLPKDGEFQIMLNNSYVDFDVAPRIAEGVPLTPFRHLFQEAGGVVMWQHELKEVSAQGMGRTVWFKIGRDLADVNGQQYRFETTPFLDSGRVIVPLSFMVDALNVKVQFDPNTGHVLVSTVEGKGK